MFTTRFKKIRLFLMAKILLHIGSPKTASTSLQELFFTRLHRKNLINYLGKFSFSQVSSEQERLYWNICSKITYDLLWGEFFWDSLKNYQQKINPILLEERINVFSEERLFSRDSIRGMIPFSERVKRIQALFKGHSVEVFCCLRRQPEYFFSRYVQNYRTHHHYITKNSNIARYYQNFVLDPQSISLMLNYVESLAPYRNAFGKVNCLFFEELLEDGLSYYNKLAKLLEIKMISEDIVKERRNVRERNQKGYITHFKSIMPFRDLLKAKLRSIVNYNLYRDVFIEIFFLFCAKVCSRIFVRYNIFLTPIQKKKIYTKLMGVPFLLLNFLEKPKLHPYFSFKQKKTILDLCQKMNQELVKENFCKKEDLKKYGYL